MHDDDPIKERNHRAADFRQRSLELCERSTDICQKSTTLIKRAAKANEKAKALTAAACRGARVPPI